VQDLPQVVTTPKLCERKPEHGTKAPANRRRQILAHASERSFLYTARPFSVLGWILYMPQIASVMHMETA